MIFFPARSGCNYYEINKIVKKSDFITFSGNDRISNGPTTTYHETWSMGIGLDRNLS